MWERYKTTLASVGVIVVCVFGVSLVNNAIQSKVSQNVQEVKESVAKEMADKTIQLENEKIELEKKLKNELILSQQDLAKCKIELEESKNKKELKDLSKKDPSKFKKTVDSVLGVRGKTK